MMWKKAVIGATIVIAVILSIIAVKPSQVQRTEFVEEAHYRLTETKEIPFLRTFEMSGFGISGSWEGPGHAQVWLVENRDRYLVFDTRTLLETVELSAYGSSFEGACIESCDMPGVNPTALFVFISGPGMLSIDAFHYAVPLNPSGLAVKTIQQSEAPDHSMLVLVMLLVVAVIGSHTVGHFFKNPVTKKVLVFVFLGAFLVLGGVFGVSVAAPTTAIAVTAKKAASICAAVAFIALFIMIAIEMLHS
ncbi:MAG: hypothetical protein L0287_07375, partial [Anaerolineae bacterium]|nr:hypothetical protein [Anaerolineae bacterium]